MAAKCADRQLVCHSSSHASVVALDCMEADIVETTFKNIIVVTLLFGVVVVLLVLEG